MSSSLSGEIIAVDFADKTRVPEENVSAYLESAAQLENGVEPAVRAANMRAFRSIINTLVTLHYMDEGGAPAAATLMYADRLDRLRSKLPVAQLDNAELVAQARIRRKRQKRLSA